MLSGRDTLTQANRAFTLIELMIVVAIIAIIAAIAIPGLMRSKMSTNESSTIGTLKTLATAQIQFKGAGSVDTDNDGDGEFGFLAELAGTANCRTNGGTAGTKLLPPAISMGLGLISAGSVSKAGYEYRVYLPTAAGLAIFQNSVSTPNGLAADAAFQELRWVCYAWPSVAGNTGNRVFAVAESGEIMAAGNVTTKYDGKLTPAPPEAAIDASGADPDNLDPGFARGAALAADGQTWNPAQ